MLRCLYASVLVGLLQLPGSPSRVFLVPTPEKMAIAFVTTAKGIDTWDGTGATTIATGAWNLANTDRLIVVGIRWETDVTISSVTDTAGNTYSSAVSRLTMASSVGYIQVYYTNTTATNAANVVTATFSASTTYRTIIAAEYSGATATPLDVTATGVSVGSATSVTSGSFTPTETGEVAVAFASHNADGAHDMSAGTNYILRDSTFWVAPDPDAEEAGLEDRLDAPASAQTASMSDTTASWWGIIVATFKAAAVAAGGRPSRLPLLGVG